MAPNRQYQQRWRETHFGLIIAENEEVNVVLKEKSQCHDEFQHVPTNHSGQPVKVVAGDLVLVNPN